MQRSSGNNADGWWNQQWDNSCMESYYELGERSKWGGAEETSYLLLKAGKKPFGLFMNEQDDIYITYFSDEETRLRDEDGYTVSIKMRTFNLELLFSSTGRRMRMSGDGGNWESDSKLKIGFCGQCHNPNGNLYNSPDLAELRRTLPDLISVDLTLSSTFIAGASMTYSINFLTRGEPGIYLTHTPQERFGPAEVDWGFNLNIAYYNGNPSNINKQLLAGPINSISGGFIYGGQVFEASDYSWIGIGVGVGLSYGISYGRGHTYLGWW